MIKYHILEYRLVLSVQLPYDRTKFRDRTIGEAAQ